MIAGKNSAFCSDVECVSTGSKWNGFKDILEVHHFIFGGRGWHWNLCVDDLQVKKQQLCPADE